MRARSSRRSKSVVTTLKSGPVMVLIAASILLGLAALGRSWHEHRNTRLNNEVQRLRGKIRILERDIQAMRVQHGQLTSPQAIEKRLRQYRLDLAAPSEDQFLRVVEPRWEQLGAASSAKVRIEESPRLPGYNGALAGAPRPTEGAR